MRLLLILAVIIGVIWFLGSLPPGPADSYSVIDSAKDSVRNHTKDPDSVRFGQIWQGDSGKSKIACGYFNAKNSFGGYTGQQRFIAGGDMMFSDETAGALMDKMWSDWCVPYQHG
ncbi:MAG: hypothetical protein ACYCZD_12880 [Rhodanobacter sp.]